MSAYAENLWAQDITPVDWSKSGFASGAKLRPLRVDPETGASTLILDLPAGLVATAQASSAGQDWFLLSGTLQIGSAVLKAGAYCYYPAGSTRPELRALEPSTVLALYSATPQFRVSDANHAGAAGSIPYLDTWSMQWMDPLAAATPSEKFRTGVMVKVLRQDAGSGEQVYLAGLMPGWYMTGIEVHGYEENYCLSGDVHIGEVAGAPGYTMTPGCYMSRAPRVPHGPIVSKNGNVNWVHVPGRMVIDYEDHARCTPMIRRHLEQYPWR